MKKIFILITAFTITQRSQAQTQTLCDFEGTKHVYFKYADGDLDSAAVNPSATGSNTSAVCALYIRDTTQYDNLQMITLTKFDDISYLASASATAKMTMKVWSNMPVGTRVEIQLGSSTDMSYPSGIHSVYTATTAATRAWETLTFNFSSVPGPPSFMLPGSIDKLVILFNPNSHSRDSIYFDEVMGPTIIATTGLSEKETVTPKVYQNSPNPCKESTSIKLFIDKPGTVNVTLYDLLGKPVAVLANEEMAPGAHTLKVNTEGLSSGIYFYELKRGSFSQSMKMIVTK